MPMRVLADLACRALYASWWIDGLGARAIGRDRQSGFYLEPSYRFPFEAISIGGEPGEAGRFLPL